MRKFNLKFDSISNGNFTKTKEYVMKAIYVSPKHDTKVVVNNQFYIEKKIKKDNATRNESKKSHCNRLYSIF